MTWKTIVLKWLHDFIRNNNSFLWYFCASASMAGLDVILVLMLKARFTEVNIVIINTISIVLTTIFHYLWISNKAFNVKIGISSLLVYLTTFIIGLTIQDFVIWLSFEVLRLPLLVSKAFSLGSSFFILFFLRKTLFSKLSPKKQKETKYEKTYSHSTML